MKDLAAAKSRLELPAEAAPAKAALVLAMLADTIAAARRARRVDGVTVVTPDVIVARQARVCGASVLLEPRSQSLNDSLAWALSARADDSPAAVLLADLPCLQHWELDRALREAGSQPVVCSDRDGAGTVFLSFGSQHGPTTHFGADSFVRHVEAGFCPLRGAMPGLRHDVDTYSSLLAARMLGMGPATSRWFEARLPWCRHSHPIRSTGPVRLSS
ncbi:2-phospho-L-lactate guanylyltransferase [Pseudonocardia sp. RS010]|uniref:2-phospho-L-lactate guanylyltransferase n=1 Tax=Pseudonocardia sp. RS010 TaxID=3385979 RepID=UPI00399FCE7F